MYSQFTVHPTRKARCTYESKIPVQHGREGAEGGEIHKVLCGGQANFYSVCNCNVFNLSALEHCINYTIALNNLSAHD